MKPHTGVDDESVIRRPSVPVTSFRSSMPPLADQDASVIDMPPPANFTSAIALSSAAVLSACDIVAPHANASVGTSSLPKK